MHAVGSGAAQSHAAPADASAKPAAQKSIPIVGIESSHALEPSRVAQLKAASGHKRTGSWSGQHGQALRLGNSSVFGGSTPDVSKGGEHHRFSQTNKGSLSAVFKGSATSL